MPIIIRGSGNHRPRLFICGERPGPDDVRHRPPTALVGPAGQEFWTHFERETNLTRDDCWVTYLVPTCAPNPITDDEIAAYQDLLLGDLYRVRPSIIVAVGYQAARWFLPQFKDANGDIFHGLPWPFTYGRLTPRHALVVPVLHPMAALKQADRGQNQLTHDLRAVREVVEGARVPLVSHQPQITQYGLATTIAESRTEQSVLGLDTEGILDRPWSAECVSIASSSTSASLIETHPKSAAPHIIRERLKHVQAAIDAASVVAIHHAKHDLKTCITLGLRVPRVDDTMVMAYILNLPQGLKELCARLFGWQMSEYFDLIRPLDDARVSSVLESAYESLARRCQPLAKGSREGQTARRQDSREVRRTDGRGCRQAHTSQESRTQAQGDQDDQSQNQHEARTNRQGRRRDGRHAEEVQCSTAEQEGEPVPRRALTSLRSVLDKSADSSKRERWSNSKFAALVPLPPMPTWKDLPVEIRTPYALTDAAGHHRLRQELWSRIEREGLERVYWLDMSVLPFLVRSEMVGMACNERELARLSRVFQADLDTTIAKIQDMAGRAINPNAAKQVSDLLFDELGIRPTRMNKSKTAYTTQDKYLKARRSEHDIIQLILDARQLRKYISTYTSKLPSLLQDGRYYPQWKYTRTATGRLAEVVILLIPKHDPLAKAQHRENRAKAIRNCFHATDGHELVSVDLSQIELRVMAHVSRDEKMLAAYASGQDLHAQTAHELLGAPKKKQDQDESAHRLPAKTVNFGIINGMTEYGMLDQLHEAGQLQWDLQQVQEMLRGWFEVYSGVSAYWEQQKAKARTIGYVESMYGRRRYLAGIHSTDERVVREAERQCLFAIQSSADEISKAWNARLWRRVILPRQQQGQYCEPWVRVHDDTTLECSTKHAKDVATEMLRLIPQPLDIPSPGEAKRGTQWGDLT